MSLKEDIQKRLYASQFLLRVAAAATPNMTAAEAQQNANTLSEELLEVVAKDGKFSKGNGGYFPAPCAVPGPYIYMCKTCRFYEKPESIQNAETYPKCTVLGKKDDDFGGEAIHPYHWCPLWVPHEEQVPNGWITQWIDPQQLPVWMGE